MYMYRKESRGQNTSLPHTTRNFKRVQHTTIPQDTSSLRKSPCHDQLGAPSVRLWSWGDLQKEDENQWVNTLIKGILKYMYQLLHDHNYIVSVSKQPT